MGFPSNLVGRKAAEPSVAKGKPFGVTAVLIVIGACFVASLGVGFFLGLTAAIGAKTFRTFNVVFPGP